MTLVKPQKAIKIPGKKCIDQSENSISSSWQILVIWPANPFCSNRQIPLLHFTIPRLQGFVKWSTGICWWS